MKKWITKEETLTLLKEKWPEAIVHETFPFNEITLEIKKEFLREILFFLKNPDGPGFEVLMDLTGVDYLLPKAGTRVIYWLHGPSHLERLRLTVFVERDELLPSVTDLFGGANWYERELYDLFGVQFENHPDLKRILMPDNWIGHPLRRDYALTEEAVEFKHGVKPKVPSEIIPHVRNFYQKPR